MKTSGKCVHHLRFQLQTVVFYLFGSQASNIIFILRISESNDILTFNQSVPLSTCAISAEIDIIVEN